MSNESQKFDASAIELAYHREWNRKAREVFDNQPDGFKSEDADAIKEQGGSA